MPEGDILAVDSLPKLTDLPNYDPTVIKVPAASSFHVCMHASQLQPQI